MKKVRYKKDNIGILFSKEEWLLFCNILGYSKEFSIMVQDWLGKAKAKKMPDETRKQLEKLLYNMYLQTEIQFEER